MRSKHIGAVLAVAALTFGAAGVSYAGATSGKVWLSTSITDATTPPVGTPDATFVPGAINYNPSDNPSVYTIGAFLNNPVFSNQSAAFVTDGGSGASMGVGTGNTFIQITGTVGLLSGANSFVVAHDDGVLLNITGFGNVVTATGPTAESFTPFTVNNPGAAGNFAFTLNYVECCSPPAALVWSINNVTVGGGVPEPAAWSMMILGVGMVGFTLRRRRQGVLLRA
jgi:hypothetical protein